MRSRQSPGGHANNYDGLNSLLSDVVRAVLTRHPGLASSLGRGLINAQPQTYGRKLDEREVVGRQLVVAGCHTPTVLDFVEEPFDQVTGTVEIRAEADRLLAIASWRNIGPDAPLGGKGSDPAGVIATVSQQH